jgi:Transposase DNA-binding
MRTKKVPIGKKSNQPAPPESWIKEEMESSRFPDTRLAKRFGNLLEMISRGIGDSIPAACQD